MVWVDTNSTIFVDSLRKADSASVPTEVQNTYDSDCGHVVNGVDTSFWKDHDLP